MFPTFAFRPALALLSLLFVSGCTSAGHRANLEAPCSCGAKPQVAATATADADPLAPAELQRMAELVKAGLTADTVAERARAILGTTIDHPAESLAKTIAAIRRAQLLVTTNMSNAQTTAYKRSVPVFVDGGKRLAIQTDWDQGALENTNRPLDLAIAGDGFFRVTVADSMGDGPAYTRSGGLFVNHDGELVVGMGDGYQLLPAITIPRDATSVSISHNGRIEYLKPSTIVKQTAGQLQLVRFRNMQGLKWLGGSIYVETPESGKPIECKPGEDGSGAILQNFLEGSNVDVERERLRLARLKTWDEGIDEAIRWIAGAVPAQRHP